MGNVTLKDIAGVSGYSFSLVSRVLRNKGIDSIPQKTIQTIRDTASEMGYIVNRSAQSLKMNRTNIVAVVLPVGNNFSTTIFPPLTEAIVTAESIDSCKMDFIFFNTLGGYKEYENLQEIISLNPEGVIYSVPPKSTIGLSQDLKRRHLLNDLAAKGKPIMFLMEKYDVPGSCTYMFDDFSGAYEGTKFLADKGCKSIVFMQTSFESRLEGYKKAMDDYALTCEITQGLVGFTFEAGYEYMRELKETGGEWPDGILATCDTCAMGILRAMRDFGLKDNAIQVMGYDCITANVMTDYSFYSVKQPIGLMGRECTEAMLNWIETGVKPESKLYKPEIVTFTSSFAGKG